VIVGRRRSDAELFTDVLFKRGLIRVREQMLVEDDL